MHNSVARAHGSRTHLRGSSPRTTVLKIFAENRVRIAFFGIAVISVTIFVSHAAIFRCPCRYQVRSEHHLSMHQLYSSSVDLYSAWMPILEQHRNLCKGLYTTIEPLLCTRVLAACWSQRIGVVWSLD